MGVAMWVVGVRHVTVERTGALVEVLDAVDVLGALITVRGGRGSRRGVGVIGMRVGVITVRGIRVATISMVAVRGITVGSAALRVPVRVAMRAGGCRRARRGGVGVRVVGVVVAAGGDQPPRSEYHRDRRTRPEQGPPRELALTIRSFVGFDRRIVVSSHPRPLVRKGP